MRKTTLFLLLLGASNLYGMTDNIGRLSDGEIENEIDFGQNKKDEIEIEIINHASLDDPPSEEEIEEIVRNFLELNPTEPEQEGESAKEKRGSGDRSVEKVTEETSNTIPGFNVREDWFDEYGILKDELVKKLKEHQEMCIQFDQESNLDLEKMTQIFTKFSNKITHVIFHKANFEPVMQRALNFLLDMLPNLKSVKIYRCRNLTLTNYFTLPNIEEFALTGSKTTNIIEFNDLSKFKKLKKLTIRKTAFAPKDLPKSLKSLRLVGKRIDFSKFSNLRKKLPNLKRFRFYRNLDKYDRYNTFNLKTLPKDLRKLKLSFANLKSISKKQWDMAKLENIYLEKCKKTNVRFAKQLKREMESW